MQHFRDEAGVVWDVYVVDAETLGGERLQYLPPGFEHGWLVFESDTERRRFAPIPDEWERLGGDELRTLFHSDRTVRLPKALPG